MFANLRQRIWVKMLIPKLRAVSLQTLNRELHVEFYLFG